MPIRHKNRASRLTKRRRYQRNKTKRNRIRKIKGGYTPSMRRCGSGLCRSDGGTIVTYRDDHNSPDSVPQFVSSDVAEEMRDDNL
jgi:hypothetical protein